MQEKDRKSKHAVSHTNKEKKRLLSNTKKADDTGVADKKKYKKINWKFMNLLLNLWVLLQSKSQHTQDVALNHVKDGRRCL